MTNKVDDQLRALQELIKNDSDLRALSRMEEKINIFKIIKNGATEIRHSNILAWLLQAHEQHGLGEIFPRELIKTAIKNNPDKADILDWAFLDYSAQIVQTEEKNIDITVKFENTKHILAIENKTKSTEHDAAKTNKKQTITYRQRIEEAYPEYKKLFIYLTPSGEAPADGDWCMLSYEDVLAIIEELLKTEALSPEVALILSNYCMLIKSDVIGKDNELFRACNEVYQNHTEALDLLFKCVKTNKADSQVKELCNQIYALYENELDMVYNNREDHVAKLAKELFAHIEKEDGFEISKSAGKTYISFSSQVLDQYLPRLDSNTSSWNSTNTYLFWFCTDNYKDKGVLRFALELGGKDLPERTYAAQNRITSVLKPNDKRAEYKYKIIRSETLNVGKKAKPEHIKAAFDKGIALAKQWTEECIQALKNN